MDLGYGLGSDSLEWRAQMWDERGRESGPTLTFKPSSSPDTRHNNLLPAATQFNDLWGGHHLKPPMQKNTFSGNIWQHYIPLSKTPPVVGKSIVWHGMKIVCLSFCIYSCLHFSSWYAVQQHALQRLLRCWRRQTATTLACVCAGGTAPDGSDGRRPLLGGKNK